MKFVAFCYFASFFSSSPEAALPKNVLGSCFDLGEVDGEPSEKSRESILSNLKIEFPLEGDRLYQEKESTAEF